jgi:hypothetical protein
MAPLISAALQLAPMVPRLTRLLAGDKAADVAEKVIDVTTAIAGVDEPEQAIEVIQQNPELQLQLQQQLNEFVIAEMEQENETLRTINKTIQTEAISNDPFVRRWRPFFGYTVAVTWFLLMLALGIVIVITPEDAPDVINAMTNLSLMWSVALAVLGISVNKRSQDKQVAAGQPVPAGLLSQISNRIFSKSKTNG